MSEKNKYLALYPDGHHEEVVLGELINKGGASGKIYADLTHKNCVAKIYHERKNSETNRQKLEGMLAYRPNIPSIENDGKEYIQIAWPIALLEDDEGYCVGYLMPLIDIKEAISLDHLMQKAVRQRLKLSERYVDRVFAAYNITSVVAALHERGHYIVDLKPANIFVYKNTMLVALFDCDGFSIKGEHEHRYPAEFVSEEYIYPEGMNETCEQMGEEQDKFALAVIIFRLLNEGIHPFAGTPRKNSDMQSIQERIFNHHYAYGIWPDEYQAPNPYSIHEYFDKETLNLFERAFTKGNTRPSAIEWQNRLEFILKNLKRCKKDPNHAYFTPKGCGLCMVAEKLKNHLQEQQKQQQETKTKVRGVDISKVNKVSIEKQHKQTELKQKNLAQIYYGSLIFSFIFFTLIYKLLLPFKDFLIELGIFSQAIIFSFGILGIIKGAEKFNNLLPENLNRSWLIMLKIYAIICLLIAFISINSLTFSIFALAQ